MASQAARSKVLEARKRRPIGRRYVMKRVYLFLLGIIASLAVGCGDIYNQDVTIAPTGKSYDNLTASFDEADTRVYLESDLSLSWHSGDLISVFYGNNYKTPLRSTARRATRVVSLRCRATVARAQQP